MAARSADELQRDARDAHDQYPLSKNRLGSGARARRQPLPSGQAGPRELDWRSGDRWRDERMRKVRVCVDGGLP
ncbi:MAG: hypothetical protein ACI91B_002172 [Planctomycetota bacterium]|jgi:hypothetical protein